MCLLVAAFETHPDYRLVLIGHRDEFHARPAAALDWWQEPRILAGRDLQAGGTWLGVDRAGRLGVVTNFRSTEPPRPDAPSRGLLIPEFLAADAPAPAFAARLAARASDYAGFSLLLFDGAALACVANRPRSDSSALEPGLYGLSNASLDEPWPKLERSKARVQAVLARGRFAPEAMFAALMDRQPAADAELPSTGIGLERERALSSSFIVGPDYGTRCTTLVQIGRDGLARVEERRYAPTGETTGRTTLAFHTTRAPSPGG